MWMSRAPHKIGIRNLQTTFQSLAHRMESSKALKNSPLLTDELNSGENLKIDTGTPNSSWSKDLCFQYEKYCSLAEAEGWERVSSYFDTSRPNRLFTRALPPTGKMFEYFTFLNRSKDIMHGVIQFGPWLEGPTNFVHGGAIAAIFDAMMGKHLYTCAYTTATMNLNVDFKKPLPIGIVAILETKIEGRDGRKVFTSGVLRSMDGSTIFDTCKGIWFDFKWKGE